MKPTPDYLRAETKYRQGKCRDPGMFDRAPFIAYPPIVLVIGLGWFGVIWLIQP